MTTTIKLNPIGLLSRLAASQSSGCLELDEGSVSWKLYLQQGNINYVFCSIQLLDELKFHLHNLGFQSTIATLKHLPSAYLTTELYPAEKSHNHNLYSEVISWLITQKYLNYTQGLKLIEAITKDALNSCLWLNDRGLYLWHNKEPTPVWIKEKLGTSLSINVPKYLSLQQTRLKQWQNCSAKLLSVHQRPYFTDGWETKPLPQDGALSYKTLKKLSQALKGRSSLRQLSLLLQKDELYVAKVLSPYINDEIIALRNAKSPLDKLPNIPKPKTVVRRASSVVAFANNNSVTTAPTKIWKLVCIDDSPTILQEIQRFLNQEKFKVTVISDPVQSVSVIFRIKPDLILLDITMPRINGYKLCGLLRGSEPCSNTPIIMVTGNKSLIDKARAKLAGATDYLTKPFTQQRLTEIIEKHLS